MDVFGGKIKNKIISDLKSISNLDLLNQILEFLRLAKLTGEEPKSNKNAVLSFGGIISNEEAIELRSTIDKEFNQIEVVW
ncbi:MAG: hypothetical protein H6581_12205 [Bacteroidia bacterium]|nr:hypothetical protein [Bacteroidia bacterium]